MKRIQLVFSLALVLALSATALAGEYGQCTATAQECLDKMATKLTQTGWAGLEGDYDEEHGTFKVTAIVAHGPAEHAGLQVDDVLFGINGNKFADMSEEDWGAMKAARAPGKTVTYMFKRAGEKQKVDIVLAEMPRDVLAKKLGNHMVDHVTVASVQ